MGPTKQIKPKQVNTDLNQRYSPTINTKQNLTSQFIVDNSPPANNTYLAPLLLSENHVIIEAQLPAITALIQKAANASDSVAFNALYALFPKNTPAQKVHATLEAACIGLADFNQAIYSVVMVKKDTGLPGDAFFATYKAIHDAEYTKIAGDTSLMFLTLAQRQLIVNAEKTRVYAHAKA